MLISRAALLCSTAKAIGKMVVNHGAALLVVSRLSVVVTGTHLLDGDIQILTVINIYRFIVQRVLLRHYNR
jgi:hypothetical protein